MCASHSRAILTNTENMKKTIWTQGTLKTYKPARLCVKGVQVTRAGVRVDTNKGIRAWFMRAPFRVMREY